MLNVRQPGNELLMQTIASIRVYMKELLRTQTLSEAQAVRLRLEGVGVEAFILGESLAGALGGGYPIYIDDRDEAEARRLLADSTDEAGESTV